MHSTASLLALGFTLAACSSDAPPVYDAVVVGAGPAGLAAAWELEQAGRRAVIVDGREAVGGRARWGMGLSLMAGTATQAERQVEDSPEALLADWAVMTGELADDWERAFVQAAPGEVHDWLVQRGVRFVQLLPETSAGVLRIHEVAGGSPAVVDALASGLESELVLGRWVTGLEPVPDGGWRVLLAGEPVRELRAAQVVLATGSLHGVQARADAVAARSPCSLDAMVDGKDGPIPADADPLAWLASVSPHVEGLDRLGTYPHVLAADDHPYVDVFEAELVAGDGRRLLPPGTANSVRAGNAVAAQPECEAWALFDQRASRRVLANLGPERSEALLARGALLRRYEDVSALAAGMQMEASIVSESLERVEPPGPVHRAPPPRQPPYWAARLGLVAGKSFGGLQTDAQGRLLDKQGEIVPGLWAAGEVAGMGGGGLGAPHGFDGSLSAVVYSGRVAGRHAAEE